MAQKTTTCPKCETSDGSALGAHHVRWRPPNTCWRSCSMRPRGHLTWTCYRCGYSVCVDVEGKTPRLTPREFWEAK